MSDINWEKVETIVDKALDLPEQKRMAFVKKKCRGNERLKGEVTLFLESISDSEGWLDDPKNYKKDFYEEISDDVDLLSADRSLIGKQVGSYIIKEQIGEGGMGTVYLAERLVDEFEHRVAIKIMRHGKVTDENIRRFRREQGILAGLNHPGIARLFDGGVTEDGFPYIIMEYVDGTPIDKYCRRHHCGIDEKLTLCKQVLESVRHAHENLVIHRDLKPGNILVDNDGNVKVLDFGISKLLEEDEDSESLTRTNARLLTPRYAAPEQIRHQNITTATDLYAFGVVFYELLTGSSPFNGSDLSRYDLEQVILENEPPRPSTRISSVKSRKKIKGDLDAIALKAIRKEPEKRYRVANEFLEDLKNFQNSLPVSALEDSMNYRLHKFFKRYKKGILVAAGLILLIIGFAGFYTWRIAQERNQAQVYAEHAEEIKEMLVSILQMNNPSENSGKEITVSEVLNKGLVYLEEQEIATSNRAQILGAIGTIQINTGDVQKAGTTLQKAMNLVLDSLQEKRSSKTISVGTSYAEWHATVGNFDEADKYYGFTDSLFRANEFTSSNDYIIHQLNYSDFLSQHGKYRKSLKVLDAIKDYTNKSRTDKKFKEDLSAYYNRRAISLKGIANYQAALENYERALELKKEIYGPASSEAGLIYHNMASLLYSENKFERALPLEKKAYAIRLETLGSNHQLVGSSLHTLSVIMKGLKSYDQALAYEDQALQILKEVHGTNHYRYAMALRNSANILIKMNKYESAKPFIDQSSQILAENYGKKSTMYGYVTNTYSNFYKGQKEFDKASNFYDLTLDIFRDKLGEKHPSLNSVRLDYAKMEIKRNHFENAISLLEDVIDWSNDNSLIDKAASLLAECRKKKGDALGEHSI